MNRENGSSLEEMGLKPEETRTLNDAELIKGGARYDEHGRLKVTQQQHGEAKGEMAAEKAKEFRKKVQQAKVALAKFKSRVREYWKQESSAGSLLELENLTNGIPQQSERLGLLMQEVKQLYVDTIDAGGGGAFTHDDEIAFGEVQRPYALLKKISA